MKNGLGVIERTNGDRYEGEWKNNKIDGKGHFTRTNGEYYNGEWSEN